MKKTLTVNLGGTVFHIDEDAYQLLDKYLTNLRIHFKKEEGSEEIMNDFEMRISELFNERIRLGYDVITIVQVEDVIKRMGKPEELFGEEFEKEAQSSDPGTENKSAGGTKTTIHKRFFRNPDDKVLGGVCGGLAAYFGWDPTPIRLVLFVLMFLFGVTIPIYLILWLIIPVARTATEKLQMRGESVTIESIGKTVTDGFEKVSSDVNDYINSGKPRTGAQRLADGIVDVLGIILKVSAALLALILFPPLLLVLFVLIVVFGALIFGGGFGMLYHLVPSFQWDLFNGFSDGVLATGSFCVIMMIGIPVVTALYLLGSYLFKWKPISTGVKWTLLIVWFVALVVNTFLVVRYGIPFWTNWDYFLATNSWHF